MQLVVEMRDLEEILGLRVNPSDTEGKKYFCLNIPNVFSSKTDHL